MVWGTEGCCLLLHRAHASSDLAAKGGFHRRLLLPAAQGTGKLRQLIDQAAGRISVMPAGGITEANIEQVVRDTGAQEVHSSARR